MLDISVLGRGHMDARNKTGIHRVVLEIACGLARRSDLDVIFCSASPSVLLASRQAWEEHPLLSKRPFAIDARSEAASAGISRLARWSDHLKHRPALHELARKFLSVLERLSWKLAPPIPRKHLTEAEAYLSLFDPLPPRHLTPRAQRGVFIHDLIPVLFPHLSTEGGILRRVVASVKDTDFVLTNSNASKQDLVGHGFPPESVHVAHLFADPDLFPLQDSPPTPDTASPYVLALGNIEPRKNLGAALDVFETVCGTGRFADHKMILVGNPTSGHLERIPDSIQDRVVFAGRVPDEQLAPLLRGAKALLFPSVYEGFGLPALEAMQCGTPVLSSNRSSMPEVVGDAALQFDPDDRVAFAAALERLLDSDQLRLELSSKGLRRAELFTRERFLSSVYTAFSIKP